MTRTQLPLQERLDLLAKEDRDRAGGMPPGAERDALVARAEKMERASRLTGWLNSSELRPPEADL
jgi:hypothetical protein